jgi:transposase
METYIGLDAHSSTCTFISMDKDEKIIDEAKVATTERNLLHYIRSQKGKKYLVFEESGMSKWLFALFKKEVDELTVCHPGFLGKRQGAKFDRNDAIHLANELRCGHVVSVYHEQSDIMDLRALVGAYKDVVTEIVRTKNRYKAIFRSEAIATKGQSIYGDEEKIQQLSGKVDQLVAKNLFDHIAHLESTRKKYLEAFGANMKRHSVLRKLDTVPGIDVVRAHVIASYVCSGERFKNKHKLWSYAMLVRHAEESDGRIYGKRIHFGRIELKEAFLGVAESAILHGSHLRKQYDRLRSAGVSHQNAKLAVARKTAAICLQILKHDIEYDDKFEEKQERLAKKKVLTISE